MFKLLGVIISIMKLHCDNENISEEQRDSIERVIEKLIKIRVNMFIDNMDLTEDTKEVLKEMNMKQNVRLVRISDRRVNSLKSPRYIGRCRTNKIGFFNSYKVEIIDTLSGDICIKMNTMAKRKIDPEFIRQLYGIDIKKIYEVNSSTRRFKSKHLYKQSRASQRKRKLSYVN